MKYIELESVRQWLYIKYEKESSYSEIPFSVEKAVKQKEFQSTHQFM